jgi:hypothetical protein
MSYEPIRRVNYLPTATTTACLNGRGVNADFEEFHGPSARLHHRALHDWGVASGLEVSGAAGQATVTVAPGVAIDRKGQLIVLSDTGLANVGDPTAGQIVTQAPPVPLSVTDLKNKRIVVTIQFFENRATGDQNVAPCGMREQVPWVRLHDAATFADADELVVLGVGQVDDQGNLSGLMPRFLETPIGRKTVGQTLGELSVRKSLVNGTSLSESIAGTIGAGTRTEELLVSASVLAVGTPMKPALLDVAGDVQTTGKVNGRKLAEDGLVLDKHVADRLNPHGTTAEQVGALPSIGGTLTGPLVMKGPINFGVPRGSISLGSDPPDSPNAPPDFHLQIGGDEDVDAPMSVRIRGDFINLTGITVIGGSVTMGGGLQVNGSTHLIGPVTMDQQLTTGFVHCNGSLFVEGMIKLAGQLQTTNAVTMSGELHATSIACTNLTATHKSFRICHPLAPAKTLYHGCLEGPEAGVYYRGEAQLIHGRAVVSLPDYFEALTRTAGRTAMLTPIWTEGLPVSALAASEVRNGMFIVVATDDKNPSQRFCWEVKAVRADIEPLEVEPEEEPFEELRSVGQA